MDRATPAPAPEGDGARLRYLYPGWFASVMGLSGLSLAWMQAEPLMGPAATATAAAIGALAGLVFVLLLGATVVRALRHAQHWAQDRRHPVRHTFVATLPNGIILLASVGVALFGPAAGTMLGWALSALWWAGSLSLVAVTVWLMSRWWGSALGGLPWASVTPALFIPVVGHVLAPMAGVTLGQAQWAAAQFGIGVLFWMPALALLLVRLAVAGPLPDRLRPTVFVVVAPPAASGLSALSLGAPEPVGWMLWGVALFSFLWAGSQSRAIAAQPFGLTHWGMSFPLAALAGLTLRLAQPGGLLAVLGPAFLALASLVIAALVLGTLRGLRDGSLLVPEPQAPSPSPCESAP